MAFLRRLGSLGVIAAVALLAASCVGMPIDLSWADVSLIGSPSNILTAFNDRIVQVDPVSGLAVNLRDASGTTSVDDQGNPRVWQAQVTGGSPVHFYSRPIPLSDNTLLAASYEGMLYRIDIPTAQASTVNGAQLPGHVVGNLLMTDNFLYVPISDNGLVALNPSDFSVIWTFTGDEGKGVWAQPLLVNDTLYVPAMNHKLFALDAQTGTEKWSLDLEGSVASTPVYANNALYVGSFARKLFKITLDGTIAAEYPTNDWVWGAPDVVDNMVYVGDLGGYVYALKDSGSSLDEVWSRKVANGAIRMTPLVTGDTIVVGSRDHFVYWISRDTGEETFKREMVGEVLSNILLIEPNDTVREPTIIVSTIAHDELLVAFSLDKGERRWKYGF